MLALGSVHDFLCSISVNSHYDLRGKGRLSYLTHGQTEAQEIKKLIRSTAESESEQSSSVLLYES